MRIDGRSVENFSGLIDHGNFDAGAYAGIEAHRYSRSSGCCEKQIFEVRLENADGRAVGLVLEPHQQIGRKRSVQSGLPGELGRIDQPSVCRPAAVGDVECRHDLQLGRMRPSRLDFDVKIEIEKILVATA